MNMNTVIPFVIFPNSGLLSFSVGGTWPRPTVWTININRDHFIFIEFFLDGKRKFQSKNLIHSSIDDYLFLKFMRGTWQRPRKMLKILFYRGNMTKGNMAKGITVIVIIIANEVIYIRETP